MLPIDKQRNRTGHVDLVPLDLVLKRALVEFLNLSDLLLLRDVRSGYAARFRLHLGHLQIQL